MTESTFTGLSSILTDEDVKDSTRREIARTVRDVWLCCLSSANAGKGTEKQKILNLGIERIIKTALGEYKKEVFNSTRSTFKAELKYGNRIKHAFKTGRNGKEFSPDSSIMPSYSGVGNNFVFLYKAPIKSHKKNAVNAEENLIGQISQFHAWSDNKNNKLIMLNLFPMFAYKPDMKTKRIRREDLQPSDLAGYLDIDDEDVPGSASLRMKRNTVLANVSYGWDQSVMRALDETEDALRSAIEAAGENAVPLQSIDLTGVERIVRSILESYDPLSENAPVPPAEFYASNMNDVPEIYAESIEFPEQEADTDDAFSYDL